MKTLFISILTFACMIMFNTSQAQSLQYAINMGGSNYDVGVSIVTDNIGNSYSTGNFSGVANFGGNTLTAYQGSSYILKTDHDGYTIWAKYFPGNYSNQSSSMAIDNLGYIYVTGFFQDTVDFDPNLGITNLVSSGNSDVFVIKMDTSGNLIWAKNLGGLGVEQGIDIKVDNAGNVYTIGYYMFDGDYDPSSNVFTLPFAGNTGYQNMFISKLDNAGNFVWAKSINQMGNVNPEALDIDYLGNLYATGEYNGIVDFDPGSNVLNLLPPSGSSGASCFMLKLNSSGNLVTVKNFTNGSYAKDVKVDNNLNIYITGYYVMSEDFDPDSVTSYTLNSEGLFDVFVLKLNSSGNFIWAKSMGGSGYDQAFGITTDNYSNVYTTGLFTYTTDFDPGAAVFNLTENTSNGQGDVFVSKLDANGNFAWAAAWGGNSYDQGASIAIDNMGNVLSTGYFNFLTDFDPNSSSVYYLYGDNTDVYISKLGNMTNLTMNVCSSQLPYVFNNQNLTTSGIYLDTLVNSMGGDSLISLNFVVNQASASTLNQTSCSSFTFNGQIITASGTYYDTLSNAVGCDSIITLNLTVNNINQTVTQSGTSLTSNESGANYQWLKCPTYSIITGATSQTFNATGNGSYAVKINKNNCIDTSNCITVTGVGIDDSNTLNDITISPNPTIGIIMVSTQLLPTDAEINIINSLGQIMLTKEIIGTTSILDISKFANGIYYIELIANNKTYRKKLVKN